MAQWQRNSIALSVFWLSAAWLVVALVGTAFLLSGLYSQALDRGLGDTLAFNVESLVERIINIGDPESGDIRLGDPRFTRPSSGWYWAIRDDASGQVLNLSPSTVGLVLPELAGPFDATRSRSGVLRDSFDTQIRMLERQVTVGERTLRVAVTGNLDEIFRQVDDFRGQALIVLGAVGAMLAIMSAIVARFALRPIGRLRAALERVREGEAESVTGDFPRELSPLGDEVNQLLRSNAQIIERARSQVGNLAHGLKTPLAVLRNEATGSRSALAKVVLSESEKMGTMVSTYLERARLAARTAIVGKKTDPTIVMLRLARVMGKIHPGVTVAFRRPDASLPWFRGDESDFEEMVGNLLDNACKFSRGEVAIQMLADRRGNAVMLLVKIEDNGPGLTEAESKQVLKRGVRLDEKTPGSGLGLDIVKELVDVYGGSLELSRSVLGGLLVELRLPAAKLGPAPRL